MGNTKVNKYLPRGNSSQWYKLEKINRRKTTVFDIYDIYTIKLINQIGVLVTEVLVLFGYSRELPNQLLGFQIPTKMQIKQFVNQMRLLRRPVCQEWLGLCKLVK